MKWKNKGHEFDDYYRIIENNKNGFILWGFGLFGKRFYERMKNRILITEIWDEKVVGQIDGIDIVKPDMSQKGVFVIVTGVSKYNEISRMLIENGFIENKTLFHGQVFNNVYFAYAEDKVYIDRFDVSITKKCTLNCKKCNMFMPYYKNPGHKSVKDVTTDLEAVFKHVSHVDVIDILGGEPFLYPYLMEILEYIMKRFADKVDKVSIVTNGTIIPDDELLDFLKSEKIMVSLSYYLDDIPALKDRFESVVTLLNNNGIEYVIDRKDGWKDFAFPDHQVTFDFFDKEHHFDICNPPFRGLDDKKYYQCHIEVSAMQAGLYNPEEKFVQHFGDYLDLTCDITTKEFMEYNYGFSEEGYVSLCRYCAGCGDDNTTYIKVAEQLERSK